jgi:hypothetical protein
VLWHYVREHLTRHEYERYLLLKHVWTDLGRGRAWLRSSLNEHSLERYLHCMLGSTAHLSIFFEDWAFLLDQERSSMLPTMAAGLLSLVQNPYIWIIIATWSWIQQVDHSVSDKMHPSVVHILQISLALIFIYATHQLIWLCKVRSYFSFDSS